VKECFESSLMLEEKFLKYRDFQVFLQKIARTRYFFNKSKEQEECIIQALLLKDLSIEIKKEVQEKNHQRWDHIRTEMIKHSVLEVLEVHLPKLTQVSTSIL
jgi:hypothetical protein